MKVLKLTDEEVTAFRQLLDVANKTLGIRSAQVCLVLDAKLQNAVDDGEKPEQPPG